MFGSLSCNLGGRVRQCLKKAWKALPVAVRELPLKFLCTLFLGKRRPIGPWPMQCAHTRKPVGVHPHAVLPVTPGRKAKERPFTVLHCFDCGSNFESAYLWIDMAAITYENYRFFWTGSRISERSVKNVYFGRVLRRSSNEYKLEQGVGIKELHR
jgi:hypothetical protein